MRNGENGLFGYSMAFRLGGMNCIHGLTYATFQNSNNFELQIFITKVDLCVNITKVCCLYGDIINVVEN